ncbi:MAG: rod shape-determining protein MreD [Alphaproteobacteria bacterium]|nr:rod shape-determining protein MreD [Alphaproteobacteria bacterium]MCL2505275.1 rod shape-determining protein MreD [Alphaproteobacteria bacterium]
MNFQRYPIRTAIPFLSAVLLAFLGASIWSVPYIGMVMPPFAFIALFYWASFRPDLFPVLAAFAIGLLTDIIAGTTMGITALVWTAAYQAILRLSVFLRGQSFFVLWLSFALVSFTAIFFQWFIQCIIDVQFYSYENAFVQSLFTVALFPLPCYLFIKIQRYFLKHEE